MHIASSVLSYIPGPAQNAINRVKASPLGYRMARGAFWAMSGAVISRTLMLLANIIVARILTREVYGELGIIRSTINMFTVFAGFNMGLTATKYVAEFHRKDPERVGRIVAFSSLFVLFTGLLISLSLFAIAPWLAVHSLNALHLSSELRICSLILLISAMNGAQSGTLAGFEAFKSIARVNLLAGLFSFPVFVFGAYFFGLRGSVCALGINLMIQWLFGRYALQRETAKYQITIQYKKCYKEWPVLISFCLPAMLSGVLMSPVLWICNSMLVNQSDGYGQMGLFDAANQWQQAILFIPGMIGQIALPMLSNLSDGNSKTQYIKVLKVNLLLSGFVAVFVAMLVALASPIIMQMYGKSFKQGCWVLVILSLTTVLISINTVVRQAIASKGKMWFGLFFDAFWAVTLIFNSYVLIKKGYGALGYSISYLVSYLLLVFCQVFYINKILKHK